MDKEITKPIIKTCHHFSLKAQPESKPMGTNATTFMIFSGSKFSLPSRIAA
jgi:hypothetical protein